MGEPLCPWMGTPLFPPMGTEAFPHLSTGAFPPMGTPLFPYPLLTNVKSFIPYKFIVYEKTIFTNADPLLVGHDGLGGKDRRVHGPQGGGERG